MEEDIVRLIIMYQASAKNLRNVADMADEVNNPDVARVSRAKAATYDLVRRDLELIIENSKGT